MSNRPDHHQALSLPSYEAVRDALASLALPMSGSELHGIMCGYLSAGAIQKGDAHVRALFAHQKASAIRAAAPVLFELYTVSQQQLANAAFELQLLLPHDDEPLLQRVKSFSEWCDGFTQGIRLAGIEYDALEDEEAQDAIEHITEFAELDCESLQFDEDDERALLEISEYARMAVVYIHSDLTQHHRGSDDTSIAH